MGHMQKTSSRLDLAHGLQFANPWFKPVVLNPVTIQSKQRARKRFK